MRLHPASSEFVFRFAPPIDDDETRMNRSWLPTEFPEILAIGRQYGMVVLVAVCHDFGIGGSRHSDFDGMYCEMQIFLSQLGGNIFREAFVHEYVHARRSGMPEADFQGLPPGTGCPQWGFILAYS